MIATEFISQLRALAPSSDDLRAYGLDDSEVAGVQRTLIADARAPRPKGASADTEIERLLLDFDCSRLEIAGVRFLGAPEKRAEGVAVCLWEADSIVVLTSGELAAFDHGRPSFKIADCALDSEHFLDALAFVAAVVRDRTRGRERVSEAIAEAARRAGGARFEAFFRGLLGFLQSRARG